MAWYEFWNWFVPEHTVLGDWKTIHGTSGDDLLWGTASVDYGVDYIYGYGGNDWMTGNGGADHLDGGAGIDSAFYDEFTVGVTVNLATGRGYGGSAEGDTLVSIEYVYGSYHNDRITGNDDSNDLYGLSGNDVLSGGGGVDGLAGDEGNDILQGGAGADYLEGGEGVDTAVYWSAPATAISVSRFLTNVTVNLGVHVDLSANQAYWGDAEGDTFSGIENVTGSAYDDVLTGTDGRNVLVGSDGTDRLSGLGDDDTLDGGAGADVMIGGLGSDTYFVDNAADAVTEYGGEGIDEVRTYVSWTLTAGADVETLRTTDDAGLVAINLTGNANGNIVRGNDGNNVIGGGDGNDELTGLGGQDRYLFDTPLGAANVDRIVDFNVADDTILLDDDTFSNGLLAGNSVAGSQFVIGPAALDAGDRIIYNSATGAVYYDSDGTGAAAQIQFALLNPGLALTNFDFLVVA